MFEWALRFDTVHSPSASSDGLGRHVINNQTDCHKEIADSAPCLPSTLFGAYRCVTDDFARLRRWGRASVLSIEDSQEEEKDVQAVKEDRRGKQRSSSQVACRAQPLKIDHGEAREDHETGDRVDE